MEITAHFYVFGRVQGVGFRAWTRRQAQGLQISGWVRNRQNGCVEIYAVGEKASIEKLQRLCLSGPMWSSPERLEAVSMPNAFLPAVENGVFSQEATV